MYDSKEIYYSVAIVIVVGGGGLLLSTKHSTKISSLLLSLGDFIF